MSNTYKIKLTQFDNEVIYDDDNLSIEKCWECNTSLCDTRLSSLYIKTDKERINLDLNGNITDRVKIKEYLYIEDDFYMNDVRYAKTLDNRWVLVDKDYNETPINIDGIVDITRSYEDTFKINIKSIDFKDNASFFDLETDMAGCIGFIDKKGKVIVKPQYITATGFLNGRAIVCRGEWRKDQNTNGYFADGLLFGIIDKTGKEIVECKFDSICTVDGWEDKYFAKKNGKWGIIDLNGNWVVEPIFDNKGYYANNNIVDIWDGEYIKFYDIKNKKYVFDKAYFDAEYLEKEDLFKITEFDDKLGYDVEKIVDINGQELFPSKYSYIDAVHSGRRLVWINGPDKNDIHKGRKYGFIDAKGKEIVPCVYENIDMNWHHETNDIFIFAKNGKWGISDFNQNVLVKPQYESIITCRRSDLAIVRDDKDLYGLITIYGKALLPIQYEYITPLGKGYFLCKTNNKTEMMRVKMKHLKPFNIDKAKVVILGSFPGEQSLEKGQYYANPTNQFWNLLGIEDALYKEKLNTLAKMGIGLWDVIKSCDREGSLDKNIKDKTIEFNDLSCLKGKTVYFNGKKAFKCYKKYYNSSEEQSKLIAPNEKEQLLPSSSRANTSTDKKNAWTEITKIDK